MATPFEVHLGAAQGRIKTANAADGSYAFELGHATHLDVYLEPGDRHDVSQTFNIDAEAMFIRARVRLAAPPVLPVGHTWIFEAMLNGSVHYGRNLTPSNRIVTLHDIAIRLLGAPTSSTVTFRLRLA